MVFLACLAEYLPVTPVMTVLNLPWFFRSGFLTGVITILIGLWLGRRSPRIAAAGCALIVSAFLFIYSVVLFLPVGTAEAGFNIWMSHSDRYGFLGYPNTQGTNWNQPNFGPVTYSFDNEGWRQTLEGREGAPVVAFLGCSFTFGIGCKDSETYPGILAKDYWQRFHVKNCALAGKGTTHAYLIAEDLLANPEPPKAILYAYIPDHVPRNSLRESWWRNGFGATVIAHFELRDGRPQYLGLKDKSEATLPDSEELTQQEIDITVALVDEMYRMCQQKDVPFFMVLLNEKHSDPQPDPVIERLTELGVPMIDAREASNSFFPDDPHPTKQWHAAIAYFLAQSPELQFLRTTEKPWQE